MKPTLQSRLTRNAALVLFAMVLSGCVLRESTKLLSRENATNYLRSDAVVVLSTQCEDKHCADPNLVWQPFEKVRVADEYVLSDPEKGRSKNYQFSVFHNGTVFRTRKEARTYHVLDIRPGIYTLSKADLNPTTVTHYNFGTYSFTANPGDFLYLGNFNLGFSPDDLVFGVTVRRDLDIDGAQRYLQTNYPELATVGLKLAALKKVKYSFKDDYVPSGVMWYVESR